MLKIGLVGCGQIARLHVQRTLADGRATIVALCDPLPEAMARLNAEFDLTARTYDSPQALLGHAALDAVILCTPTQQHFEQVRLMRAQGLAVLCEKPLADSRERVVQLVAECQTGPLLSVAYQRRYSSPFRTLRREIQSGRWGAVKSITLTSMERWQPTIGGTWRDDPSFNPGGFLGDAGSHKIDMLFYLTGLEPQEVFAYSEPRGSHVEIASTVVGRLSGGVALSMTFLGDAQHFREDYHIHCAEADLLIRDQTVWIARNNMVKPLLPLEPDGDPNAAFHDMLLLGSENTAPAACALPVWDLTQGILKSARTRSVVTLP